MMKKAAIVLARYDSKRLKGKALLKLGGVPLLQRCINSIRKDSEYTTILATTTREVDNPLVEFAKKLDIPVFRGDCNDVAKRVVDCIDEYKFELFARVNGDSPFLQRSYLLEAFNLLEKDNSYDFATNLIPRRFPYGISVEVFRSSIFAQTYNEIKSKEHKEHVTSYFYRNINKFHVYCIAYPHGDDSDVRMVVDTPGDLENMEKVIGELKERDNFDTKDLTKIYRQLF